MQIETELGLREYEPDEKIIIPPGYKRVTCLEAELALNPGEVKRWTNMRYDLFTFDPTDEAFNCFLNACRKDTAALRIALRLVYKQRQLPVYNGGTPKVGKRRIEFLIRPPYFHSPVSEISTQNRVSPSNERDEFFLHIDETHTLQSIRSFIANKREPGHHCISARRHEIYAGMKGFDEMLKAEYGNWPLLAENIANRLEVVVQRFNSAFKGKWTFTD